MAAFLDGGGGCGAALRGLDWTTHPLGPPEGWPLPLKLVVRLMLNTQQPMIVFWGEALFCFYNDAFSRSLGADRHPAIMGRPGRGVWEEIWPIIGPQIDLVMRGDGSTWQENALVPITRNGVREDVWWSYCYAPIEDPMAANQVGGVLVLCTETTSSIKEQRRQALLLQLEETLRSAPSARQAVTTACGMLGAALDLTLVGLSELEPDRVHGNVVSAWAANGVPPVLGRHYLPNFGLARFDLIDKGEIVSITDVMEDPRTAEPGVREFFAGLDVRASIDVPLLRAGKVDAVLFGAAATPRQWSQDDVALMSHALSRLWEAIERMQAEDQLLLSNTRLREATRAAKMFVWENDLAAGTTYWGEGAAAVIGCAAEDLPTTIEDSAFFVAPEDRPVIQQLFEAAAAERAREYIATFRGIGDRHWRTHATVSYDDKGAVAKVLGVTHDVSEQATAMAALSSSRAMAEAQAQEIEALYATAPVGLAVLDRDLRYVRVNDRFAEINGVSAAAHVGRTVREVVPDLEEAAVETMQRVLAGEPLIGIEFVGTTPAAPGVQRTWRENWLPLRDAADQIVGVTISTEEITHEKAQADQLAQRQARLDIAKAAARLGIHEYHIPSGAIYWDARVRELWGVEPEELITYEVFLSGVHPADHPVIDAAMALALDPTGDGRFEAEYRVTNRKDGVTRWVAATGLVTFQRGEPVRLVGTVRDITQRRDAERRQAFLLSLADQLRAEPNASLVTARALGEHFGVSRAGYTRAEAGGAFLAVEAEWADGTVAQATGGYDLRRFGASVAADLAAGLSLVIEDVTTDARTAADPSAFLELSVRSVLAIPIIDDGQLAATAYLADKLPRVWHQEEIALLDEVAQRTWSAVQRERAEQALRLKTQELEALVSNAPLGVGFFDRDHRYLRVNAELAAINGVAIEDHIGRRIEEVLPDKFRAVTAILDQVFATGDTIRNFEVTGETPREPGVRRSWLTSYYPVRGHDAGIVAVGAWVVDISDRKEAEERLKASEARMRAIVEAAPVGLVFAEAPSGRITGGNAKVEDIIGHKILPSEDTDSYREWVGFHPDGRQVEGHEYPLAQVVSGTADRAELETLYRRGDGSQAWIRFIAAPIKNEAGEVTGGVVASLDVDQQRRAEAELRRLNASLAQEVAEAVEKREVALNQLHEAQKMETIGQLTGGVAHDFNNLLSAILSNLDVARKRVDDLRVIKLLDGAIKGAERGSALTKRLLAFARRQDLKAEPVDIAGLFAGMQDLLVRSLGPGVRIATELPRDLPPVIVDPNQLELALLNLAVNARDAMPFGGTVKVEARRCSVRAGAVDGLAPGDYVRISVVDTGQGMDAATLQRATEPFFTTKGIGKGTGLGLSMVHGLVAQSQGAMRIASTPGRGTTVELWLPQAQAHEPPDQSPNPVTGSIAFKAKPLAILVVDDDVLVSMGTAAMLEDLGHAVLEAASGRQALELFDKTPGIDLVITDHAMPGMTGVQLAEELRRRSRTVPIVLASGYAELPNGEDPGLPRLAKPFRQEDLRRIIEDLIWDSAEQGKVVPFPR